jgi:NADH-quinone oxidoreductase subunit J
MLDVNLVRIREGFTRYLPVGILVSALILLQMVLVLRYWNTTEAIATTMVEIPNTTLLGMALYTTYLYPFEIAAAILLVAMIAAITLTMRARRSNKYQKPEQQVNVRRADRVRLVKMLPESRD